MMKSFLLYICLFLSGCTAEGNSVFLSYGETRYFMTMGYCEKEALSENSGGEKKYSGYECREMLFGFFLFETKRYYNG